MFNLSAFYIRCLHRCFGLLLCGVTPVCIAQASDSLRFHFADGTDSVYFYLEKQAQTAIKPASLPQAQSGAVQQEQVNAQRENWFFVVGGSGCASMGRYLPGYFRGLEGESGRSRIWLLQKRHVAPQDDGASCSEDFVRDDHFSRWQADQLEFIRFQLAQSHTLPPRVILMGISEGAELAPVLALSIPSATHLVLLAHSGDSAMGTYQALAQSYAHMHAGWEQLQAALATMPANPDLSLIHGRSWRYWAEIQSVKHLENLRMWKGPVLWALGDADPLIPKDARHKLQQMLGPVSGQWRNCVFHGADHGLDSQDHRYLPDFMWQLDRWLAAYPQQEPCLDW